MDGIWIRNLNCQKSFLKVCTIKGIVFIKCGFHLRNTNSKSVLHKKTNKMFWKTILTSNVFLSSKINKRERVWIILDCPHNNKKKTVQEKKKLPHLSNHFFLFELHEFISSSLISRLIKEMLGQRQMCWFLWLLFIFTPSLWSQFYVDW